MKFISISIILTLFLFSCQKTIDIDRSLRFENVSYSTHLPLDWIKEGSGNYNFVIDTLIKKEGDYSLRITSSNNSYIKKKAGLSYELPNSLANSNLKFGGSIKVENLSNGYASIHIEFTKKNGAIMFFDMQNFDISNTLDWKKYEREVSIPKNASNIKIGVLFKGEGKAWFDDLFITNSNGRKLTKFKAENKPPTYTNIDDSRTDIKKIIDAIEKYSLNQESIDWIDFRKKVYEESKSSVDSGISLALTLNGILHSSYKRKNKIIIGKIQQKERSHICDSSYDFSKIKKKGVIVINVPTLVMNNSSKKITRKKAKDYIDSIKHQLVLIKNKKINNLIIDLSRNEGGNMWPMLIALSDLFPEGVLGHFINNTDTIPWTKSKGKILLENNNQNKRFYTYTNEELSFRNLKLAVIIGESTASSGEAIAIALKSLKNATFFGDETYGFSTANKYISFGNGESLLLTSHYMADKNKNIYTNGINPDIATCNNKILTKELIKYFGL